MKKRVGVITFLHNENYGSTLQAWALQKALNSLGCEAEHIDYRPSREENPADKFTIEWDDTAKAPYVVEVKSGDVVCTFDDPRAIAIKCDYIAEKGMRGAMYWDYDGDTEDHTLARAVWEGVMNR